MVEVEFEAPFSEPFSDGADQIDFDLLRAEGEAFVAPAGPHAEGHVVPLLHRRAEHFGRHGDGGFADGIHLDREPYRRREGLQPERLRQLRQNRLHFRGGKGSSVDAVHPDSPPDPVNPADADLPEQMGDVIDQAAFEHIAVVAFGRDFVIAADDAVVHDFFLKFQMVADNTMGVCFFQARRRGKETPFRGNYDSSTRDPAARRRYSRGERPKNLRKRVEK